MVVPSKPYTAAVVLYTDIFGYKTAGIRAWADKLAAEVRCHAEPSAGLPPASLWMSSNSDHRMLSAGPLPGRGA